MGKNTMPLLQNLTEDELASIVEIGAMRENTFDKNEISMPENGSGRSEWLNPGAC